MAIESTQEFVHITRDRAEALVYSLKPRTPQERALEIAFLESTNPWLLYQYLGKGSSAEPPGLALFGLPEDCQSPATNYATGILFANQSETWLGIQKNPMIAVNHGLVFGQYWNWATLAHYDGQTRLCLVDKNYTNELLLADDHGSKEVAHATRWLTSRVLPNWQKALEDQTQKFIDLDKDRRGGNPYIGVV